MANNIDWDRKGTGIVLGIVLGAALGIVMDNIALWMAAGIGIGVAFELTQR